MAPQTCSMAMVQVHVKANGRTPYRDAFDSDYNGELVPFGETVLYRIPLPAHRKTHGRKWHRADAILRKGLFVGRTEESNEAIILKDHGAQTCRTLRRLPPNKRALKSVLETAKGLPWAT